MPTTIPSRMFLCIALGTTTVIGTAYADSACETTHASLNIQKASLQGILAEVQQIAAEGSEDAPTARASATAQEILNGAQGIAPIRIDATTVESSDGDILIHWDTASKSIVLICPRDNRPPSIYSEVLDGKKATMSQLRNNASALALSEALAWLTQP